jgi:hypothetical protein
MKTSFLLLAQYEGLAVIPADWVRRDYFPHLTLKAFLLKATKGEIPLPIVRVEPHSQKTAKGIHINDLARFLDTRAEAARHEQEQLKAAKAAKAAQEKTPV